MKKIIILVFPILLFAVTASAQTKRIATLSHSGKITSINRNSPGNYGETPEMRRESNRVWDSIYKIDSARYADSLSRIPNRPKADTGARQMDSGKPQQQVQQRPQQLPIKAGTWLQKSKA